MFAIIETGGKQYKVSPDKELKIEKLEVDGGEKITFDKVLLVADGDNTKVGKPYVDGAKVEAEVLQQGREKKKIVFRYKSKTRHRVKKGHRQLFTEIKILSIQ